jgi:hypothetical protein
MTAHVNKENVPVHNLLAIIFFGFIVHLLAWSAGNGEGERGWYNGAGSMFMEGSSEPLQSYLLVWQYRDRVM